ncbi:proline-rich receptor-like protein kinase PERK1 [Lolium rigidum]|uniref:proline-rich receptor-like protein kinase PERK1 n=1 Tax=Lolium rigidum TaxID=89674 RepID=UPI001F5C0D5C|nr:proline-rich receptor-like protein kinase PERK1 [Lolium rigidum]
MPSFPPPSSTTPPSRVTPAPPGITPSPPSGGIPNSPRSFVIPPSSSPLPSPSHSHTSKAVIGISVASAVVVIGLVAGLIYCFVGKRRRQRRRGRRPPPDSSGNPYNQRLPVVSSRQQRQPPHTSSAPLSYITYAPRAAAASSSWHSSAAVASDPPPPQHPAVKGGTVSYADLAAATGGFSEANLLGQGGFGHVYRGELGNREVAIKRLRPGSGQGDREFRAEVESIGRVHHRHLVSLLGYCVHDQQRLLVYEHVSNHTLEFHLHGDGQTLDWERRWKIALGSAKGIAYLHEDCHPKIIHRDIKAANILLEDNFEPKVSDFGLAKIQNVDDSHVSTRVMGTFGYMAPEYTNTGKITDRSDVFSFGVVLLEIITGMRPVLPGEHDNDETLVSWARPLLAKNFEEQISGELIDPMLESTYDAHEMQRLIACAAAAVRDTSRSRPRMSQIVRYLEGELPLDALNAGVEPGQSETHDDGEREQLRRMRRMAFFMPGADSDTGATGIVSEATSEYGLYASSSSSGGDDAQTTNRPRASELGATSRRTRPGRAGLL